MVPALRTALLGCSLPAAAGAGAARLPSSEQCDALSLVQRDMDFHKLILSQTDFVAWGQAEEIDVEHPESVNVARIAGSKKKAGKSSAEGGFEVELDSEVNASSNFTTLLNNGEIGISYMKGEWAEIKSWVQCKVLGNGTKPGLYNINASLPGNKIMEFTDLPYQMFRRPISPERATNRTGPFRKGEDLDVVRYDGCNITGRGTRPNTYNAYVPKKGGHLDFKDVPTTFLRKIIGNSWLMPFQLSDPALPSDIPGQHAVCRGVDACRRVMAKCVATKTAWAERNCGGSCDVVFLGDSLMERLSGRLCYSGWKKFPETGLIFKDIIKKDHAKSLILAGSVDETSHTLYTLQNVLPVLKPPKAYFVLAGTNNIPKGGSGSAIRGLRAIVTKLQQEHPESKVLLHAILPRSDDRGMHRWNTHIHEANTALKAFVSEQRANGSNVEFVNCTGSLMTPKKGVEYWDTMHLHPTNAGYKALLSCVKPILDKAVTIDSLTTAPPAAEVDNSTISLVNSTVALATSFVNKSDVAAFDTEESIINKTDVADAPVGLNAQAENPFSAPDDFAKINTVSLGDLEPAAVANKPVVADEEQASKADESVADAKELVDKAEKAADEADVQAADGNRPAIDEELVTKAMTPAEPVAATEVPAITADELAAAEEDLVGKAGEPNAAAKEVADKADVLAADGKESTSKALDLVEGPAKADELVPQSVTPAEPAAAMAAPAGTADELAPVADDLAGKADSIPVAAEQSVDQAIEALAPTKEPASSSIEPIAAVDVPVSAPQEPTDPVIAIEKPAEKADTKEPIANANEPALGGAEDFIQIDQPAAASEEKDYIELGD